MADRIVKLANFRPIYHYEEVVFKVNLDCMSDQSISSFKEILKNKKKAPKPPAYEWQDLALRVIQDLGIPGFKRNSVFKVCRDFPKEYILRAMADTKELASGTDQWRYFFKIIDAQTKKD